MEDLTIFDQYPLLQIILYIIIAVIGGVVYKYWDRWLGHSSTKETAQSKANQLLIENLQNRINAITESVTRMENERNESHKRELDRTKMLADSEARVQILTARIQQLEERLEVFSNIIKKYREKYGDIDES